MADLERDLQALAAEIAWPRTPRFSVVPARPMAPARWWGNPWLAAAAAVILALALVLAASPPARETLATWLGLRGAVIQRVPHPPTPTPLRPGPLGQSLSLGNRMTLEDARAQAGFPVLQPSNLGRPDEVYFDRSRNMVTLVYASAPGLKPANETGVSLLISEFPGRLTTDSFAKMGGPDTKIEQVNLGTGTAFYISGPHIVTLYKGQGTFDESRLAADALIWQRGDVLLRIEGKLTKQQAIAIAHSLS